MINTVISWVSTVFPGGPPLRRLIETGGLSTSGFAVESGQVVTSREIGNVSAPYPGPNSSQGARTPDRCACVSCCPRALPETSRQVGACGPQTPNPGSATSHEPLDPVEGGRGGGCWSFVCCMCIRLSALENNFSRSASSTSLALRVSGMRPLSSRGPVCLP